MKKNNLKILFAASECAPLAKVGGLGDVIGSLPKALRKLGIDVRICLPRYGLIDFKKYGFELFSQDIDIKTKKINIYQGLLPESSVVVYLLDNKDYFGDYGVYLGEANFLSSFQEVKRFLFFSQAVLAVFDNSDWKPDIIHCHDWHTAIIPLLIKAKSEKPEAKTLLTIHNLANQGKWNAGEILKFLELNRDELGSSETRSHENDLNILVQGILNADLLNTVSPTYSKEILTKEYGGGLEKVLLKRRKDISGILNGIDYNEFDPDTDPSLKTNYSLLSLEKRVDNKIDLQRILKLPENKDLPLFGFIGRLAHQKGIDLIGQIIPDLVDLNCQLVILGIGDKQYEQNFLDFEKKYPRNISAQIKFNPVLAQKIYAGSDFLLIPSRFEPCGLVQLIAQRYGAIPIGRKTGGLADTIEDGKTGFLFEKYEAGLLVKIIKRALKVYQNKEEWERLIKKAMAKDFSWKKSAKEYIKLYKELFA